MAEDSESFFVSYTLTTGQLTVFPTPLLRHCKLLTRVQKRQSCGSNTARFGVSAEGCDIGLCVSFPTSRSAHTGIHVLSFFLGGDVRSSEAHCWLCLSSWTHSLRRQCWRLREG